MVCEPETYYLEQNKHAPNNPYPVLVYRQCLPLPVSEEKATAFLESHAWERKGAWGHIGQRHFHPNVHECYGVVKGDSTMLVGCGNDDESGGQEIEVSVGDVIVLPAGTGHCNLQSTKDYFYVGVYPQGSPQWRNELGKGDVNHNEMRKYINAVPLPIEDPVNGPDGPLFTAWVRPTTSM
ncbi:hypothetical protein Sste5346_010187 [Sporothrix stenoceras]|uniref:Cupin type-1 domain-containing protein n=1 Tax=Sporothrix stenoceras TaxID=5173 RepID=A0ABR3YI30_9PEZI